MDVFTFSEIIKVSYTFDEIRALRDLAKPLSRQSWEDRPRGQLMDEVEWEDEWDRP